MNIYYLMRRVTLALATALVGVVWSAAAFADTGALLVEVTDTEGNPVAGAQISASTAASLTRKSGVTNADGELRLMGLDPSNDYTVTVSAEGYQAARNENVLVVTDRTFDLPFVLASAEEELEEIITYGRSDLGQLVDTTSSMQATDVTLDVMESLPTGRSYQSYLQMAPSTKPSIDGNPSSKSGVNYTDVPDASGNSAGSSTDNVYYIDGINISDNYYGTFGANFNSEIIQEQQIITGGVPAEYEGGTGLISRVVSKSGGNEFHGSVNYYMQSDSLVADNENLADKKFSTYDTAFTLGGPIIKDKMWFFTSLQRKEREEDVIDPNTDELLRTVTRTDDYGFVKLTYQPTEYDKIVAQWFNDPGDRDGSFDTGTLANRDRVLEYGGDNYKFEYSHAWDNVIVTANYIDHSSDDNRISKDQSTRNDVAYLNSPDVTNAEIELGGFGNDLIWERGKESINLTLEWFVDAGPGSHEIKFGYSDMTNEHNLNNVNSGDGARYSSIATEFSGTDVATYTGGGWTGNTSIVPDDYPRMIAAMAASPNAAEYLALYDADSSGTISTAEIASGLVFDSTAGNPNGAINVYRSDQVQVGPTNFKTEGTAFFVQDSWNIDEHWTINAGIRAEEWSHYASDGSKVFTFDWEFAPRLSVIYDIKGDGASKVWAFHGRYYDPIRTNMTDFAGTVTGSIFEEQVYTNAGEWLTFRTRGGPAVADAFFAPTTETPYTDEFMIGWEQSLTPNQSISVTYTDRKTRDILEDYDLGLYTDCSADGVGDFCLPLSYFGFEEAPEANYFIATLVGGKRDYKGWELSWRKRRSADSNWFLLASVVNNDARGNTNSDSDADFQGDVVWLDPRSPNQYGKQPGNIEWLAKFAGSYAFDNGLEIGATYRWNSGTRYSRTWSVSRRHLPYILFDPADRYEYMGVVAPWITEDAVGGYEGDSYGQLDARVKYVMEFGKGMEAEFFLDIFNVLDDQAARRFMDLSDGDGVYDFQEASDWVDPRRFYLGARVSF